MKNAKKHLIGLANEYASGTPYRIPFGLVPNQDASGKAVLQRLSKENALAIANQFLAEKRTKGVQFPGIPVYIGHPDHPAFKDRDKDIRAYGWANDLQVDDVGLTFVFDWPPAGTEILDNKHFKFLSPHFSAVLANEKVDGVAVVDIVGIRSIGFTNKPNWPGVPTLVNEEKPAGDAAGTEGGGAMTLLERLAKALGMDPAAGEEALGAAAEEAIAQGREMMSEVNACWPADDADRKALGDKPGAAALIKGLNAFAGKKAANTANERIGALEIQVTSAQSAAAVHAAQIQTANERLVTEADGIVTAAIEAGVIVLADREKWKGKFVSGFANAQKELLALEPAVKTRANAAIRKPTDIAGGREQEQLALVNELLPQYGNQFDKAWTAAKAKRPELFSEPAKSK